MLHVPKTDVSYAPTEAFAKAYPKEVKAQSEKFTSPTWAEALKPDETNPLIPREEEVSDNHLLMGLFIGGCLGIGIVIVVYYTVTILQK